MSDMSDMSDAISWRVQAHWIDGAERRSYAPVVVPSRAEAQLLAEEMAETLSHFVGLEISIDSISIDPIHAGPIDGE